MKVSIGDREFEAPLWVSGSAVDLRWFADELLRRTSGADYDHFSLNIGTTEDYERRRREAELAHEEWTLKAAAEIQRKRAKAV